MTFVNIELAKLQARRQVATAIVSAIGLERAALVEMWWDDAEELFVFRFTGDMTLGEISFALACMGVPYRVMQGMQQ